MLRRGHGSLTDDPSAATNLLWSARACLRKRAACLRKRAPHPGNRGNERGRNVTDSKGFESLCWECYLHPACRGERRSAASRFHGRTTSNEAGILVIAQNLNIYLRNSVDAGPRVPSRAAGGSPLTFAFRAADLWYPPRPGRAPVLRKAGTLPPGKN